MFFEFLDQDFCPSSCCCGSCVAFNVQTAMCFVEATLGPSYTTGITAGAVRHFIKSKGVGCVGTVVRFRGSNKLVHAPHIQHGWFNSQDIAAMNVSKLELARSSYFTLERNGLHQAVELLVLNFFKTCCLCFLCYMNYVYMQLFAW